MRRISLVLTSLGANGPLILVISVIAGISIRPLSQIAETLVPVSAFLLTLGSFLCAALSVREQWAGGRILLSGLIFAGLIVPLFAFAYLKTGADLEPAIELAVMVGALAPPVGSAAAVAAMLGLQPRLALAISITLTLAAPIIMPLSIHVFGLGIDLDFGPVVIRLLAIVGGAGLVTFLLMRWRHQTALLLPNPTAASGIAVVGLVIVGLAVTSGITPLFATPERLFNLFLLTLGMNFGGVLLGTVFFAVFGFRTALTIGLVSGNRNVTLAWAVAGAAIPADARCYLALCVVPVLAMPLLLKMALALAGLLVRSQKAGLPQTD